MFRFLPGSRLARGERQSEDKFQAFLAKQQANATEAVAQSIESVSKELAKVQESMQKAMTDSNKQADKFFTDVMSEVQRAIASLTDFKSKFDAMVVRAIGRSERFTAGGLAGGPVRTLDGINLPNTGAIHATGELRYMFNNTMDAYAWLRCDGTAHLISDYPELYQCIGNTFGTADAGMFFVPPAMNAPNGSAYTIGDWYIRT